MGAEQFSTPVRGASGSPISVAQTGTIETDNYSHGDAVSASDASDYPLTVNPAAVIQELIVTQSAPELTLTVTTTGGDTYEMFAGGTLGARDKTEIDSVEITDPTGSGAAFSAEWAGE